MDWKNILNADLGRLVGLSGPPENSDKRPVYWWTALWCIFHRPAPYHPSPRQPAVPLSLARQAARPGWKGPVYWNARAWRRDVVLVVEQLRGIVGCNAPLAPGLAAAAREEQRIRSGWSPQRASSLLRNVGAVSLFTLLCAGLAIEPKGLTSSQGVFLVTCMVILVLWFIWSVVINRKSRSAVLLALEHRIAAGLSLSEAMATMPRFFPRHLADLVEAGEVTGNLERAFDQFSDAMLSSLGFHRQLKITLLYIKIVMTLQLFFLVFLAMKVAPVWVEILQELGSDLGMPTGSPAVGPAPLPEGLLPSLHQLAALQVYLEQWWHVALAIIVLFLVWRFVGRFRKRRSWASRGTSSLLLLLPWFRGLIVRHNLGLIALMVNGLLRAGVPLDRALAMAMGTDLLPAYRHWLSSLRERVMQGESLADALQQTRSPRLVPDSFVGLLEAGERSGQLPAMFERVAALYRRETEKRMHVLAALVLPAGIFLMGYITLCVQTMVFGAMAQILEHLMV